jgi:predicted N-formylglutamate amidohydrolase
MSDALPAPSLQDRQGPALVLSCEHGGNRVPGDFPTDAELVRLLPTHRGWDAGALPLARRMASRLRAPLRFTSMSRLVVDANRDEGGSQVFSTWSAQLSPARRRSLLRRHHRRHRARVRRMVETAGAGGRPVVHVGIHTFTPRLNGVARPVEVGILFDPTSRFEAEVARAWRAALAQRRPDLRILENEPYAGWTEGLTTSLRAAFSTGGPPYAGIELEVSQALLEPGQRFPDALADAIADTLREAVDGWPAGSTGHERPTEDKEATR